VALDWTGFLYSLQKKNSKNSGFFWTEFDLSHNLSDVEEGDELSIKESVNGQFVIFGVVF